MGKQQVGQTSDWVGTAIQQRITRWLNGVGHEMSERELEEERWMRTQKFRLDPENANDVSDTKRVISLSTKHINPSTLPPPPPMHPD